LRSSRYWIRRWPSADSHARAAAPTPAPQPAASAGHAVPAAAATFGERATDANAAAVATFKNELVDGRRFPSFEHLEHEVLDFIGFYNDERLHEALDDVPPSEYEEDYVLFNYKRDNTRMLAAT